MGASLALDEQNSVLLVMVVSVCSLLYCSWQTPDELSVANPDQNGFLAALKRHLKREPKKKLFTTSADPTNLPEDLVSLPRRQLSLRM